MPLHRRSWTLGFQQIIFKRDLQEDETAHPFFLGAKALAEPFTRRAAVDLFRVIKGGAPCDLSSPEAVQLVIRVLQNAFASGDLVAARRKGVAGVSQDSGSGSSAGPSSAPRRRAVNPPPPSDNKPEKTWVEIRLVDQGGKPVPAAKYKLKITDGSVREGALDGDGRARVAGIDSGNCTVWFPEYDGKEWKAT